MPDIWLNYAVCIKLSRCSNQLLLKVCWEPFDPNIIHIIVSLPGIHPSYFTAKP